MKWSAFPRCMLCLLAAALITAAGALTAAAPLAQSSALTDILLGGDRDGPASDEETEDGSGDAMGEDGADGKDEDADGKERDGDDSGSVPSDGSGGTTDCAVRQEDARAVHGHRLRAAKAAWDDHLEELRLARLEHLRAHGGDLDAWASFQLRYDEAGRTLWVSLEAEHQRAVEAALDGCTRPVDLDLGAPPLVPPALDDPLPPARLLDRDGLPESMGSAAAPTSLRDAAREAATEGEALRLHCQKQAAERLGLGLDGTLDASLPLLREATAALDLQLRQEMRLLRADCEAKVKGLVDVRMTAKMPDPTISQRIGSLDVDVDGEAGRLRVSGTYVDLGGHSLAQVLEQVACRGPVFLDRVAAAGSLQAPGPAPGRASAALEIHDEDGHRVFFLSDNERCTLGVATTDAVPEVTLALADHLDCRSDSAGGLHCRGPGGADAVLLLHSGTLELLEDNQAVLRGGHATFLVSEAARWVHRLGGEAGLAYEAAVLEQRIGAEVRVGTAPDGRPAPQVVPIGDLQVRVEGEQDRLEFYVDSPTREGRTVALELDAGLFSRSHLRVEAWSVGEDGSETPLAAAPAGSLEDVLRPHEDGETVLYAVVEDHHGFHVLVSFPHFSEKKVQIASAMPPAPDPEKGPSGIDTPGPALLPLTALLLACAYVALRRRDG